MKKRLSLIFMAITLLFSSCSKEDIQPKQEKNDITVERVYGNGDSYCAFTSLLKVDNKYYLAFREGDSHVREDDYGVIRILESDDGHCWSLYQTLSLDCVDLRDPNLSVRPDGKLLVLCGARILMPNGNYITKTYYSICFNNSFSEPKSVSFPPVIANDSECWLWKLTWHNSVGYGAAYRNDGEQDRLTLLKTEDGISYSIISELGVEGRTINETRIRFLSDGRMIALIRSDINGYMGVSTYPYTEWTLKPLDIYLAGQEFIIDKERIICTSRLSCNIGERTAIWFGATTGEFRWNYILPSSGRIADTSYAGIIEENDEYWISYYSMHEGEKPSVYLARIPKHMYI